ncbi:MAG: DUF4861 domain-containing protein, partial [Paludibacter sp.]|nr:DUF4861 domain-containing protein [Paludibacter sp.]
AKTHYILKDSAGAEVACQLVFDANKIPQSLIFQADVKANDKTVYTLAKGEPTPVTPKTAAFFVPERKDDFAWENDLAAYRMYGPALANENPSNGVDLWLKCVEYPIMRKFYDDEHHNGKSYHHDWGEGLDCYKVAHTLGAGGVALYLNDTLWVGNHYDRYEILETGALRSAFTLTYDSVKVGDSYYKEEITITTAAGSPLNKAVVKFTGKQQPLQIAAGIFMHGTFIDAAQKFRATMASDNDLHYLVYAEDATSEETPTIPAGRNYVGVVLPNSHNGSQGKGEHFLILADYQQDTEITYYFGGGWSKWKFPTDDDWKNAVVKFAENLKEPLKVIVK